MHGVIAKAWDGLSDTVLDWLGVGQSAADDDGGSGRGGGHGPRRLAALIVLSLCGLIAWWWVDRGPDVKVVAARRGDAAEVVYATGVVEPYNWAKVTALQRKRIVDICKCEGETVKKGDVLVRLDDDEEQAVLRELQSRLARHKEDAARLEGLVKRNITARVTLDDKLTAVREAEARVVAQKDRIADLALKSPLDGVVLRRAGEIGEIAGTGTNDTLLWVGEPKPLKVVAEVNEDDIMKVVPGQAVLLRHDGHAGAPLSATVERLTPKGDPDTKTFRVHLTLPDDTPLKIGMSVEANIIVREARNVIVLPLDAVQGGTVLKVVDGEVESVLVETGIRGTGMIEVRGGVQDGDLVISPRPAGLGDEDRVRPVRTDAPAPAS